MCLRTLAFTANGARYLAIESGPGAGTDGCEMGSCHRFVYRRTAGDGSMLTAVCGFEEIVSLTHPDPFGRRWRVGNGATCLRRGFRNTCCDPLVWVDLCCGRRKRYGEEAETLGDSGG